ncbi:YdiU family protein [Nocardioides albidus]|uniref:Protein nucleotidyltransferase YdiU n=1 Tax=Nocardioides albidus TaxID=1517589 RepID=A0A5C4VYZ1_9ACTN|nr:YdiU family protein [Nocardioides albidus]TNM41167.1 YdiU family protein [Nocardioides albidus]
MTVVPQQVAMLQHRYATALPELALPSVAAAVPDPQVVVLNEPLAVELGLAPDRLRTPDGVGLLTGTVVPEGAMPVAQAYAGHQFGGFTQLGDGRALLMGELVDLDGRLRDLHLKGSGRTPFARGGDGLAVLGPMLREYVVSEAMHALGIPTTRSLAVVATGRAVRREESLPGAVLARVASSHLRVGTVQLARAAGDPDLLRRVVDHAIERHHPDAARDAHPYLAFYRSVVSAQARLIAQWMLVGFVHGVMNTDNMTLSGETIDYGPCAFIDAFDPATVFSSIDQGGRYGYANQPAAGEWNLARLAEALLPLIDEDQDRAIALATEALGAFRAEYDTAWAMGMRVKLGLAGDASTSDELFAPLLDLLRESHVDYTSFWRRLAAAARGDVEPVRGLFVDLAGFDAWLARWRALAPDADAMDRVNPLHIPRNHLVEEALGAATSGDVAPLENLLEAVRSPYQRVVGLERYAEAPPADFGRYRTFCGT